MRRARLLRIAETGVDHWGRYRDRLIPADGGWRFAHRSVRTDGYADAHGRSAANPSPDRLLPATTTPRNHHTLQSQRRGPALAAGRAPRMWCDLAALGGY